jgi:uncharacterized protein involved in outer membrane biogenesis
VQKLGRFLLFAIGAIVALAAIILLGVNLYVQSAGTHDRIQQELSQRLGTTVRLQRISVTPWGGLKLSGITIPQADPLMTPDFLHAKTFRLRVQFGSLFSQRLLIKEVSLVNPNVVWPQNANGEWRLPMLAEAPAPEGTPETTPAAPAAPSVVPAPEAEPSATALAENEAAAIPTNIPPDQLSAEPEPELPESTSFTPEIRRVAVTGGNFQFLDRHGQVVATFEGLEFESTFRTATALRGRASIAKTSLRNRFFLEPDACSDKMEWR